MALCFASSVGLSLRQRFGAASQCVVSSRSGVCQRRRVRAVHATSEPPASAAVENDASASASASASVEGEGEIPTKVTRVLETNGGYIVDCNVFHRHKQTRHTVIVGHETIEELCMGLAGTVSASTVVESLFQFFIDKRHDISNTEGLQDSGVFPINYFSLRQVFYFYPDARDYLRTAFATALKAVVVE